MTKKEIAWLKRMQKTLDACPKTFGFFTIGDPCLFVYDRRKEALIDENMANHPNTDFCGAVDEVGADIDDLRFTAPVHSTSG